MPKKSKSSNPGQRNPTRAGVDLRDSFNGLASFDNIKKQKMDKSLNTSTMNQNEKQDFLDRQITHYNQEQAKLLKSRADYDKLHK